MVITWEIKYTNTGNLIIKDNEKGLLSVELNNQTKELLKLCTEDIVIIFKKQLLKD